MRETARSLGYMPNPQLSQMMAETARTRHGVPRGTLAFLTTEPLDAPTSKEEEIVFLDACERAGTYGYGMERFWMTDPALSPRASIGSSGRGASRG